MPVRGLLDAPATDPLGDPLSEATAAWMFPAISLPNGRVVLRTAAAEPDFFLPETLPGSGPMARQVDLHLDAPVRLHTRATSRGVHGEVSWVGVPEGDPTGLAVLTATSTGMVGTVHTRGARFEIEEPLPGFQQVVQALDALPAGDGCASGVEDAHAANAPPQGPLAAANPEITFPVDPCGYDPDDDIDLLVVVSEGAYHEMNQPTQSQMWALVQNRVDWGNAALLGSNLDVRFRLVGVVRADVGDMSPGVLADRLSAPQILACLNDPLRPECPFASSLIAPLRDLYGADMVTAITDMVEATEPSDSACPDRDDSDSDTEPNLDDDSDADTNPEPDCDHDDNVGVPHVGGLACFECGTFGIAPLFREPILDPSGTCYNAPNEDRPWAVAAWEAGWNTMVHELGHALGANHGAWQAGPGGEFGDNLAYVAPDCSFQTLMGGGTPCGPNTTVDDVPFFSGECVRAGAASANGMSQVVGDDDNENTRVMALAAPYLTAYRDTVIPNWYASLGRVTTPSDGSTVSPGPVTFTVSASTRNRIFEIGVLPGTITASVPLLPGDTQVTTTPPGAAGPFTVRVWTAIPEPSAPGGIIWDYVDHRYNHAGQVRSCSGLLTQELTAMAGVVPADFVGQNCFVDQPLGVRPVCQYDAAASSLTCTLGGAANSAGEYWAEATSRRQSTTTFDYVVWGTAQGWTINEPPALNAFAPTSFCCVLRESDTAVVHEMSITGTPRTDHIRLRQCTAEHLSPVSPPLSVTIIGGSGDDVLFGSDDISTAYQEELRGGIGNDRIYGGAGNDDLIGNEGADALFGGEGNDFLFGNANNDELHGGAGIDNLQGGNHDDTLQGDAGFDELRGGSGADLLCDGFDADDLRGQDGDDRLFYVPAPPGPLLAIADPPGTGADICSNTIAALIVWPTCETHLPITDPIFNDCPEWTP
jgi:hypothetical protein